MPVQLRQTPSQRDALRVADGADLGHERATRIAAVVLLTIPTVALITIALRGCW